MNLKEAYQEGVKDGAWVREKMAAFFRKLFSFWRN